MKKIILLMLIFLMGCKTHHLNSFQTYEQLDSILKAERVLTYDSLPLLDYETKEKFWEYYFIRDSLVIRWIKRGDSVTIIKRINK